MMTMQINFHPMEISISIIDRRNLVFRHKNFNMYHNDKYTIERVLNVALEKALAYGIDTIELLGDSGIGVAYDHLTRESHTARRWRGEVRVFAYQPL